MIVRAVNLGCRCFLRKLGTSVVDTVTGMTSKVPILKDLEDEMRLFQNILTLPVPPGHMLKGGGKRRLWNVGSLSVRRELLYGTVKRQLGKRFTISQLKTLFSQAGVGTMDEWMHKNGWVSDADSRIVVKSVRSSNTSGLMKYALEQGLVAQQKHDCIRVLGPKLLLDTIVKQLQAHDVNSVRIKVDLPGVDCQKLIEASGVQLTKENGQCYLVGTSKDCHMAIYKLHLLKQRMVHNNKAQTEPFYGKLSWPITEISSISEKLARLVSYDEPSVNFKQKTHVQVDFGIRLKQGDAIFWSPVVPRRYMKQMLCIKPVKRQQLIYVDQNRQVLFVDDARAWTTNVQTRQVIGRGDIDMRLTTSDKTILDHSLFKHAPGRAEVGDQEWHLAGTQELEIFEWQEQGTITLTKTRLDQHVVFQEASITLETDAEHILQHLTSIA